MNAYEQVVHWFKNSRQMPLTFLLGFYVSLVVKRWWEQYVKLPWPDEVATLLKAGITKDLEGDEEGENQRIRRTVVRYLMLSYVLCLRRISSKVRKEYPGMECLVASGLLRKDEVGFLIEVHFSLNISSREKRLAKRTKGKLVNTGNRTGGCQSNGASASFGEP